MSNDRYESVKINFLGYSVVHLTLLSSQFHFFRIFALQKNIYQDNDN
jgi:hypothetical protein